MGIIKLLLSQNTRAVSYSNSLKSVSSFCFFPPIYYPAEKTCDLIKGNRSIFMDSELNLIRTILNGSHFSFIRHKIMRMVHKPCSLRFSSKRFVYSGY